MPPVLNVRRSLRPALFFAFALASAASPALTLVIASSGTGVVRYDDPDLSILTADQTTFTSQIASPTAAPFTDASFGVTVLDGVTTGLLSYQNDGRNDQLNLALTVESDTETLGVRTLSGRWSFVTGVGDYADFSTDASGGAWSFGWDRATDATTLRLEGSLLSQAVPEPATLAALALGTLALVRRRNPRNL